MLIKTIVQRAALLLIMCLSMPLFANAQVLRGVVTDSENNPLLAVAVQVNDGQKGVVTDMDGGYYLQGLQKGDKIGFFYIGTTMQTFTYDGQSTLNVKLESDAVAVEEVVVVGFGEQRKESVVGAITQATSEDIMRAGNVTSVSEALTGILPGVSTMQASGQPGSTAATVLIRGQSSWTSNTPLYLVDGVERDFDDLDPNEIASISVLKDASATAVYGVKAANGVILVTTKTGGISAPKITFSGTWTLKSPTMDTNYISDFPTTMEYYNQALMTDDRYDMLYSDADMALWLDPDRDLEMYTYTRWIQELISNGFSQAYNINVTGGNDVVKYFTSVGYNYDGDIFDVEPQSDYAGSYDPRTYQHRYNWRSNLDFTITKSTKLSVKLAGDIIDFNGSYSQQDSSTSGFYSTMFSTVMIGTAPSLDNGFYGLEVGETQNTRNLLAKMEGYGEYHKRSNKLYSDFILTQDITKDLVFNAKLSFNQTRAYEYTAGRTHQLFFTKNEDGTYSVIEDGSYGDITTSDESLSAISKSLYYEGSLRYNKTLGDHEIGAMGVMTRRIYQSWAGWPYKEEAWVARATYGYKRKYLLEFNGAYNGSEKFAPGHRFGFFPSLAAGWVLSEENFFKDALPWLDFLKIRYSYGEVGSDSSSDARFAYISTYEEASADYSGYYGDAAVALGDALIEQRPANEDATWETAVKQNLGIEFTTLKGRLSGAVDFFDEHRTGIYMEYQSIPSWYGGESPYGNIGETKNHGIDIEFTWNDYISKDFSYWVKGSLSLSENRVIYKDDPYYTPEYRADAGKPISYKTGLIDYGLYQSWQDIYLYPASSYSTDLTPGDLIYNDYNADGVIDDNDYVAIEDPSYASKTYAFSGGLTYKNWSISGMFNGMFSISKALATTDLWNYSSAGSAINFIMHNNDQLNAWTSTNTDSNIPTLHTVSNTHNQQTSTYSIANSRFLRLRNLEIKYRVGSKFKQKVNFIDNLEIYANGQNLLTWSPLPDGYDPEASSLTVYPISKKYSLGIRCTFN